MKRKLSLFLATCVMVSFFSCNEKEDFPKFITNYTIEEHIKRIEERTSELFATEISEGKIVNYSVDIVYAFYDNDPEYFLVELEYAEEFEGKYDNPNYPSDVAQYLYYKTKNKHLIGFIQNDQYYIGLMFYDTSLKDVKSAFMDGRSGYTLNSALGDKKYYGHHVQGIAVEGEIIQVADIDCLYVGGTVEFHQHDEGFYIATPRCLIGTTVPKDKYRNLMENNPKLKKTIYGI